MFFTSLSKKIPLAAQTAVLPPVRDLIIKTGSRGGYHHPHSHSFDYFPYLAALYSGFFATVYSKYQEETKKEASFSKYLRIKDQFGLNKYAIHKVISTYEYPEYRSSLSSGEATLGDAHGNVMKMIQFAMMHDVLRLSKQEYKNLLDIYYKPVSELTEKEIKKFKNIIENLSFGANANTMTLRLIGDETADRGSNDYFTLLLLKKLQGKVKIILSNHFFWFLAAYVQEFKKDIQKSSQRQSLINLKALIDDGRVSFDEIHHLVENYYLPYMQAMDYAYDEKHTDIAHASIFGQFENLSQADDFLYHSHENIASIKDQSETLLLFTHAPYLLGKNPIVSIAKIFGIEDIDVSTPSKAIELINKINIILKESLTNPIDRKHFLESYAFAQKNKEKISESLFHFVWDRYHKISSELCASIENSYKIYRAFGHHDSPESLTPECKAKIAILNTWCGAHPKHYDLKWIDNNNITIIEKGVIYIGREGDNLIYRMNSQKNEPVYRTTNKKDLPFPMPTNKQEMEKLKHEILAFIDSNPKGLIDMSGTADKLAFFYNPLPESNNPLLPSLKI